MGRVQVFGPPEDTAMEPDERLCTDPDADRAVVVFHPAATMLTAGGWSCASCAFHTSEHEETDNARKRKDGSE